MLDAGSVSDAVIPALEMVGSGISEAAECGSVSPATHCKIASVYSGNDKTNGNRQFKHVDASELRSSRQHARSAA